MRRLISALFALAFATQAAAAVDTAARGLAINVATSRAVTVPLDVSGTGAAGANVAKLQTALDAGGLVQATCVGTAYTNATLTIGNHTNLQLAPSCTIKQAPGTNKSLLRTKASLLTASSISVAWTSGRLATVTLAGHGLSAGQAFWIKGVADNTTKGQTAFIGVFPIVSVTDANTFTIRLRRTPTAAPTITLTGLAANRSVTVGGGGLWDYDWANNGSPTAVDTQALVFAGVSSLDVDVRVQNSYKYCVTLEAVANWRVRLNVPATRSDGLKVYGPAFDGEIVGIRGSVGDDFMSLQPKEATGFLTYPLSEGDIVGVRGGNLYQISGPTTTGTFVTYAHSVYTLDEVDISGVSGVSGFRAVNIRSSGDQSGPSYIGSISVKGIDSEAMLPAFVGAYSGSSSVLYIDKLTLGLDGAVTDGNTTSNTNQAHLYEDGTADVRQMFVDFRRTDSTFNTGSYYPIQLFGSYSLADIRLNYAPGPNSRGITFGGTSKHQDMMIIRGQASSSHVVSPGLVAAITTPTSTPKIVLDDFRFDGQTNGAIVVPAPSTTALDLTLTERAVVNNAAGGVLRATAGAYTISDLGATMLGTTVPFISSGGTATITAKTMNASQLASVTSKVAPNSATTRALRLAIDNIRNGIAAAGPIVVVGDSTSTGNHATGGTPPYAKADAWATKLVAELNLRGLPASADNFFGASNLTTTAAVTAWDARLSFAAAITIQQQFSAGGYFFKFPASTVAALGFTPANAFNQSDIWLLVNSTTPASVAILRGSTAATSTTVTDGTVGGGLKLRHIVANWTGAAVTGTLNIQAADASQTQFFGFGAATRDTANPKLEILNMAAAGSNSADWVSTALGIYAPQAVVSFVSPIGQIYAHMVNDFNSGTTTGGSTSPTALATYQANVQSYISLVPTGTLLLRTLQSNPANYASIDTQNSYFSALNAAAAVNGTVVLDAQAVAGGYTQANADGLMADDRHGVTNIYTRIGRMIAQWFLAL